MTKPKNKGGRPTNYRNTFPKLTDQYTQKTNFPTIEELCLEYLHVNDDKVGQYCKQFPKFQSAIKRLKAKQRNYLQKCVIGEVPKRNQVGGIFLLKANHGYIETERKQLVGKDNKDLKVAPVYYGDKKDKKPTK